MKTKGRERQQDSVWEYEQKRMESMARAFSPFTFLPI